MPKYSFSNEYEVSEFVQRLLSKADVERALHRYRSSGFCCGRPSLKAPEKGQIIRLYREEDMYGGNREDTLYQQERLKRLVPCYIQFFLDPRGFRLATGFSCRTMPYTYWPISGGASRNFLGKVFYNESDLAGL